MGITERKLALAMLAALSSLVSMVWDKPEPKPTWPEPPLRVSVSLFQNRLQTTVVDFPIPYFMTGQELHAMLGLYFYRTLDVKVYLVRSTGDLKFIGLNESRLMVKDIIRNSAQPLFFVENLRESIAPWAPKKSVAATVSETELVIRDFEKFCFLDQITRLQAIFRDKMEPFQGLQQLARALHDGYFPTDPACFTKQPR